MMNPFEPTPELNIIFSRRSIRKFKPDAIPEETVKLLLKAAMAAPSAMNNQPWEFVVITDPKILEKIRQNLIFGKREAPLAIAVCGNKRRAKNKLSVTDFWIQDCSAATQNLLLAACAMGLGAVWIGVHPVRIFSSPISRILKLPRHIAPLNIIYIGYPLEEKPPHTKYDEAKIHRQEFGASNQKFEGQA